MKLKTQTGQIKTIYTVLTNKYQSSYMLNINIKQVCIKQVCSSL